MKPRGIRNKNPGNIEYTSTRWKGLDDPPSDGRFCRFKKAEDGLRAMAIILRNYNRLHGINTVAEIIARWAPSNENDTRAYIEAVSKRTGLGHRQIDQTHYPTMKLLVEAIVFHENGQQPYSGDTIEAGLRLAGVRP